MRSRVDGFLLAALILLSACAPLDRSLTFSQETASIPKQEPEIELAIRDHKYLVVKAFSRIGKPTVITVHNEDNVTHGFVPTFNGQAIRAEGDGQRVVVNGMEGFHIDPGTSLTIRVIFESEGIIRFECDVHPHMDEEKLSISTRRTVKSSKQ